MINKGDPQITTARENIITLKDFTVVRLNRALQGLANELKYLSAISFRTDYSERSPAGFKTMIARDWAAVSPHFLKTGQATAGERSFTRRLHKIPSSTTNRLDSTSICRHKHSEVQLALFDVGSEPTATLPEIDHSQSPTARPDVGYKKPEVSTVICRYCGSQTLFLWSILSRGVICGGDQFRMVGSFWGPIITSKRCATLVTHQQNEKPIHPPDPLRKTCCGHTDFRSVIEKAAVSPTSVIASVDGRKI